MVICKRKQEVSKMSENQLLSGGEVRMKEMRSFEKQVIACVPMVWAAVWCAN